MRKPVFSTIKRATPFKPVEITKECSVCGKTFTYLQKGSYHIRVTCGPSCVRRMFDGRTQRERMEYERTHHGTVHASPEANKEITTGEVPYIQEQTTGNLS